MLIIGLGNPGEEYAGTYHNAGRMFVEHLAARESVRLGRAPKASFLSAKAGPNMLVVPAVFMNESGRAAAEALAYCAGAAASPGSLLIAHDDSDIPLGEYKVSVGAGAAGHHGVESVIVSLGTTEFARLRFGVRSGREEGPRTKAGEFVLRKMSAADRALLYGAFDAAIVNVIKKDTPPEPVAMS